jgi:formamidopyrimidine-DNA glycosylase
MPELPDLQVFSANLNKAVKNKVVKKVTVPVAKRLNVSVPVLKKGIEGQKIKQVSRNGKELFVQFENDNLLALHLMLHGNLYFFERADEHKHIILELLFEDDTGLALTDWQKAAVVTFNPEPKEAPDALSDRITVSYIKSALNKRAAIKNVLLDQKVIRGIGNAYADEILWDAGISPFSVSAKIPDEYVKALARSIKKVLRNAEKQIKKSNPDIITGEVRDFLLIHNARQRTSPDGKEIEQKIAGGRKTYYTAAQKLF